MFSNKKQYCTRRILKYINAKKRNISACYEYFYNITNTDCTVLFNVYKYYTYKDTCNIYKLIFIESQCIK